MFDDFIIFSIFWSGNEIEYVCLCNYRILRNLSLFGLKVHKYVEKHNAEI